MIEYVLNCGTVTLIDDEDLPLLQRYHWSTSHWGYVIRYEGSSRNKTQKVVFLHKTLLDSGEFLVDHRDRNKLNNQKRNLRIATGPQNHQNKSKHRNATSHFKGVSWYKRDKKWQAQICLNGKQTGLGRFPGELDAAKAYNEAAAKHYGEFAVLNDI